MNKKKRAKQNGKKLLYKTAKSAKKYAINHSKRSRQWRGKPKAKKRRGVHCSTLAFILHTHKFVFAYKVSSTEWKLG